MPVLFFHYVKDNALGQQVEYLPETSIIHISNDAEELIVEYGI